MYLYSKLNCFLSDVIAEMEVDVFKVCPVILVIDLIIFMRIVVREIIGDTGDVHLDNVVIGFGMCFAIVIGHVAYMINGVGPAIPESDMNLYFL